MPACIRNQCKMAITRPRHRSSKVPFERQTLCGLVAGPNAELSTAAVEAISHGQQHMPAEGDSKCFLGARRADRLQWFRFWLSVTSRTVRLSLEKGCRIKVKLTLRPLSKFAYSESN